MRIARPRRGVDAAPRRRPAARPRAARRRAGRRAPLPAARRGHARRPRRLHDPDAAPARGARPQPQLPGRVGHRASAAPATTRCRSRRSTPSCGPSSPARTCAATTPSTPAAACSCGRRRRSPTRRCRRATCGRGSSSARSAPRLTGYPVHSRVRGLHVGQGRHDERRRRRLGLRAPRRVLVDDRVLGRRPRGDRRQAGHRLLVRSARPTSRRSPCCAGPTSTPPASYVDWYPFDHPQLGAVELGGWHYLGIWTNPPLDRLRAEVAAARRVRRRPGAGLAAPGGPPRSGHRPRRRHLAGRGRRRQHRVAAHRRVGAGRRSSDLVRPIVAELGGVGVTVRRRSGPPAARPARGPGRRCASAHGHDGTPDRLLATWVVRGRAGHRGHRHRPPRPGRTRRAAPRPRRRES